MSSPIFRRVTIVGLGLLGGSVAAAARRSGAAGRVVGLSRSKDVAAEAVARGIADEAGVEASAAVTGTDLVVLATPVFAMSGVLRTLAPHLEEGTLVSDVGSVKAPLAETLRGLLPPGVRYIGAHPMAGSHASGLRHARADLLEGAVCVLTPPPDADPSDVVRLRRFFERLGACVLLRDPGRHDEEVAWVSHAPHALAYAFSHALAAAPQAGGELRGGGFRDFTRIAASDPELWTDILVTNRKALAAPLEAAARSLADLARFLESGDAEAVHRFLAEARETLARFANDSSAHAASDARSGGDFPEIQAAREAATKE